VSRLKPKTNKNVKSISCLKSGRQTIRLAERKEGPRGKENLRENGSTIKFKVRRGGTEQVRTEPNERSSSRAWKY
jgi:hypothetical protein